MPQCECMWGCTAECPFLCPQPTQAWLLFTALLCNLLTAAEWKLIGTAHILWLSDVQVRGVRGVLTQGDGGRSGGPTHPKAKAPTHQGQKIFLWGKMQP